MSFGDEIVPWGGRPEPAPVNRPMSSLFPGELALRDAGSGSVRVALLCAARFAVLQLVERYAVGEVESARLTLEIDAAAAYVEPLAQKAPHEAQRLTRVLEHLRDESARGTPAALLAAGDTAAACGHRNGAWGMYRASFDLAIVVGRNAVALSAASRLTELAQRLQRPGLARKWERRCGRLLSSCH